MTTVTAANTNEGPLYRPPQLTVYRTASDGTEIDVTSEWVPVVMQWGTSGRHSSLTLERAMGDVDGLMNHVEDFMREPETGNQFRLVQSGETPVEWFRGRVALEQSTVQASPDREAYRITVYGPELGLEEKVVRGAWFPIASADNALAAGTSTVVERDEVWQSYLPAVFNPGDMTLDGVSGSKPNASFSSFDYDNRGWPICPVFAHPGRRILGTDGNVSYAAVHWTAYMAVRSLVEWIDFYDTISVQTTDWKSIETLLKDEHGEAIQLRHVNVTGMTLPEAMRAVLQPLGFGFAVEPWAGDDGKHALRVFSLHVPATFKRPPMVPLATPRHSTSSEQGRRAQVQRLEFARDAHNIANEIIVVGDEWRREVTLEYNGTDGDLWPAWDCDEDDLADYARDNKVGGSDNAFLDRAAFLAAYGTQDAANRHVFRTFVWNEDGRWNWSGNAIPDLSAYGDADGNVSRRPRPVQGRFGDYDDARQQRSPALVEIQIAGVSATRIPLRSAQVLTDQAGFTITEPDLVRFRPYAEAKGAAYSAYRGWSWLSMLHDTIRDPQGPRTIKLFLTGSVALDRCVVATASRRNDSAWPTSRPKLVYLPDRLKYRQEGTTPVYDSIDADVVDDTETAQTIADRTQDALEDAVGHGSLMLRGLHRTYVPGDGIDRTDGREIPLTVDAASGSKRSNAPIIVGVAWNFQEGAYRTELALDTKALQVIG